MNHAFTRSNSNDMSRRELFFIGCAVVFTAGVYLLASRYTYGIGFPLDDSWIHQTYARNLASGGEWAFRPGISSAGSTSPLWSALLALGFVLHLSPYLWTYLLGALFLFLLACVCEWAVRKLATLYRPQFPWMGIFIAFEWHLAWAGMSGMETLLHGLIVTTVLVLLMTHSSRFLILGLLTGLGVWVRPDGLTLLGPVILTIFFVERGFRSHLAAISRYLIGFGALFLPYLLFNLAIGGTPMPNTFYAKQAEYEGWQQLSIITRLGQTVLQFIVGPALVLLPGALAWVARSLKGKVVCNLAAITWFVGYVWLYMSRLPAYQHGRYIMPAMPVFFIFGFLAFVEFDNKNPSTRYYWSMRATWRASVTMLVAGFIFLGAKAYAQDVAVIESEMVLTAKWVAGNLPQNAVVAAHDIGALGYFDTHELIDLAGLISPEVIPFMRDESKLLTYLGQQNADYLVAFPDFYPSMTRDLERVFITSSSIAGQFGKEGMVVYRLKNP